MIQPIQILIIIFATFALSRTYLRLHDNKITKGEFVLWTFVWTSVVIVAFIPQVIVTLSDFFGLGRGMDLAILTSTILLLYLIFKAYVRIEMIEQDITELTRKLALETKHESKNQPHSR
ncbi:DUF2304 family protein [Candidatus Woesearchaeota archaeon]|nr:DUF2304 family protein [Candidatus Woesearchaeota archaeon]